MAMQIDNTICALAHSEAVGTCAEPIDLGRPDQAKDAMNWDRAKTATYEGVSE